MSEEIVVTIRGESVRDIIAALPQVKEYIEEGVIEGQINVGRGTVYYDKREEY